MLPNLPVLFMAENLNTTLEYPINKDPFLLFSQIPPPPFYTHFHVINKKKYDHHPHLFHPPCLLDR